MSIDVLQNRIRKMKSPMALALAPVPELIPDVIKEASGEPAQAYRVYCGQLLELFRENVPAVRVNFDSFAILGSDGMEAMQEILHKAKDLGYYVILDWMHVEEPQLASAAAKMLFSDEAWDCDAVALSVWAGSDCVKPYIAAAQEKKKDVYVSLKTGNKSGSELQDLQTGGRVVYTAAGDLVSRWGESTLERCGYARVAGIAGAVDGAAVRALRQKYPRIFLLIEGLETSGANLKNCSYAFDRMGYGALLCASASVLGAWKENGNADPLELAREAMDRHKKNIGRYVTIL